MKINSQNSVTARSIQHSLLLLPSLAGFLIGTSYIPFPPWALFFCLTPLFLFWLWNPESPRRSFWAGWITQFLLNLIGFHWIAYTATEFGHFPMWGGILTLSGYAALAHLYYAVSGWLAQHVRKRLRLTDLSFLMSAATLFAICDILFPKIFPWHMGYPWYWAHWPGAQFADVIGFDGLNLVTIYANALIAWGLWNWFELKNPRMTNLSVAAGVLLVVVVQLLGVGREKPWHRADQQVQFLAVQGNIGNWDKLQAEHGAGFSTPVLDKFLELSKNGLAQTPSTDIILWPETAYPDRLDPAFSNDANGRRLKAFVREVNIPLITGAFSQDFRARNIFNAFFVMNPNGVAQPPYRKTILLAFGETFPLSEYLPYMKQLLPDLGAFNEGSGPQTMQITLPTRDLQPPTPAPSVAGATPPSSAAITTSATPAVTSTPASVAAVAPPAAPATPTAPARRLAVGPQICYEGLYPWFSAELARKGAEIFINVTNDSWFGSDFEPYQHLYMTAARAIEFRRPLMRATNTGITTAALASGDLLRLSPIQQEWTHEFRVPYQHNPPHTIYEKIVGLWIWMLTGTFVLLLVFGRKKDQA